MSATPHKCPVCNGTGLVSTPGGIAGDQETFSSSSSGPWPCRAGCVNGVLWSFDAFPGAPPKFPPES